MPTSRAASCTVRRRPASLSRLSRNSTAPPILRFDPSHPDADANGYVAYPDINPITEMVDLVGASRAYSLNAGALQAEKGMLTASLELLK